MMLQRPHTEGPSRLPARTRRSHDPLWVRVGWRIFVAALVLFVLAPLIAVVGSSFAASTYWQFPADELTLGWFREFLDRPDLLSATWVSLAVGATVAVLGTSLGLMAALGIVRGKTGERHRLGLAALLPLLFPNVALGLAILLFYIQASLPVNVFTLTLAQLVLVLPFTVRVLMIGARGVPGNAERAALNLGATPWRTFWTVTLPSMRGSVVAAAVLALVVSLDDAAVALFINTGQTITLPVRLLFLRETEPGPLIAAGGTVLLVLGILLLALLQWTVGLTRAFGLDGTKRGAQ